MTVTNGTFVGQKASPTREFAREYVDITLTTHGSMSDAELVEIDNSNGDVVAVRAQGVITNQAGTNPTSQLVLKGKITDDGDFHSLGDGTETIDTAAEDISTASTTAVSVFLDTGNFDRKIFPTTLAVAHVAGGTDTPTATGSLRVEVIRKRNNA